MPSSPGAIASMQHRVDRLERRLARRRRAPRARRMRDLATAARRALSLRRAPGARPQSHPDARATRARAAGEMRDAAAEHAGRSSSGTSRSHRTPRRWRDRDRARADRHAGEAAQHGAQLRADRRGHPRVAAARPRATEAHRALPRRGLVAAAFNGAFRLTNFLQNLFGEGVLSASFIPVYAQRARARRRARKRIGSPAPSARCSRWSSRSSCSLGMLAAPLVVKADRSADSRESSAT